MKEDRKSVYDIVTDKVLSFIDENEALPWHLPWKRYESEGVRPKNIVTKKAYQGINAFILGMLPYSTPFWATIRQINKLGGRIRKGEHGMPVVYWSEVEREETETGRKKGFFLKYSVVFNLQQSEGIDYKIPELSKLRPEDKLENCENVIKRFEGCPKIQLGHDAACYHVHVDLINMPRPDALDFPRFC